MPPKFDLNLLSGSLMIACGMVAFAGFWSLIIWPFIAISIFFDVLRNQSNVIRARIPRALKASAFALLSLILIPLAQSWTFAALPLPLLVATAIAGVMNIYTLKCWDRTDSSRINRKKVSPVDQKSFYGGTRWRKIRYRVLRKNRRCALCGSTEKPLHVDHIKPRSKYPHLAYEIDNLQVLCAACNIGKSNHFEDDFRDAH